MKKVDLFILLLSFIFVLSENLNAQSDFIKQCVANATTVGNNTYIPINLSHESPDQKIGTILTIMDLFEKKNSKLDILNWNIEKIQNAAGTYPTIYGIWVRHKLKVIPLKQNPRK